VHGRQQLDYQRSYHCCYASRRQGRRYRHTHEAVVAHCGPALMQVASVPGVFSSALGDLGYILRSPELSRIEQMVRFIQE